MSDDGKVGVKIGDGYGTVEIGDFFNRGEDGAYKITKSDGSIDLDALEEVISDSKKMKEIKEELELEANFQAEQVETRG